MTYTRLWNGLVSPALAQALARASADSADTLTLPLLPEPLDLDTVVQWARWLDEVAEELRAPDPTRSLPAPSQELRLALTNASAQISGHAVVAMPLENLPVEAGLRAEWAQWLENLSTRLYLYNALEQLRRTWRPQIEEITMTLNLVHDGSPALTIDEVTFEGGDDSDVEAIYDWVEEMAELFPNSSENYAPILQQALGNGDPNVLFFTLTLRHPQALPGFLACMIPAQKAQMLQRALDEQMPSAPSTPKVRM